MTNKANHTYENMLQVVSLIGDFLASADIKAFGHTGRATSYWLYSFFTPRMFLFSISILNISLLCGSI